MQWRSLPVFPCMVLAAASVQAGETETIIELPETVITAARVAQSQREVIGDVTVISRKELEAQRGQTLVEVLSQ